MLRPVNQPCQYGSVAAKSVRHIHDSVLFAEGCEGSKRRREGTEIRAEVVLRMVRERVLEEVKRGLEDGADCLLPFYS